MVEKIKNVFQNLNSLILPFEKWDSTAGKVEETIRNLSFAFLSIFNNNKSMYFETFVLIQDLLFCG